MKILKSLLIAALLTTMLAAGFAEQAPGRTAIITAVTGNAEAMPLGGAWIDAARGMVLKEGDMIRTRAGSKIVLNLLDGNDQVAVVEIGEKTRLALAEMFRDDKDAARRTLLDLAMGEILIKAKKLHSERSKFEVKTPISFVGVRGTIFSVSVRLAD